jgi:protein-tyrosine-phosphatase
VPDPPFTVLLMCTGNICRSALAERLGRAYLDEALGEEAGAIRLASAGTRAVVGSGMHPDSALVLRGLGAEPGNFRARQLADDFLAEADLILTMTRGHRSEFLAGAPRPLARTFTLREAAALIGLLDDDVELPGKGAAERPPPRAEAGRGPLPSGRPRGRRHPGSDRSAGRGPRRGRRNRRDRWDPWDSRRGRPSTGNGASHAS